MFGAGPGLGRAVALRYARAGYAVALVGRRREPLEELAAEVRRSGVTAYAVSADLADTAAIPDLARDVHAAVGELDVLYYGAAPDGFVPVLDLDPERVAALLPLGVLAPLALVREFLPGMIARGGGAVLSAQGAAALRGAPEIAGGLVLAAQRNWLQALHAAVADRGVYVGGLYIGAAIENTPFHRWMTEAAAAGAPVPDVATVAPEALAEVLWTMHRTARSPETIYPEDLAATYSAA